MPFSNECLVMGRALIDKATQIENFKHLPKADRDKLAGEFLGDAIKHEWNPKTIREAAAEYIVHGYLSAPTNPATNIFSALSQTLIAPLSRDLGILVSRITGTDDPRRLGEGLSMYKSAIKNFGERLDFFKTGYDRGFPLDMKVSLKAFGGDDKKFNEWVEKIGLDEAKKLILKEEVYDLYGHRAIPGVFGKLLAQGAKIGVGIDEANKAMFRRMEMDALAYRMAPIIAKKNKITEDEALKSLGMGTLTPANYQAKIRDTLSKMGMESPEAETLKLERAAKQLVFQGETGKWLQSVSKWRAEHPLAGAITVPFVKTTTLILNEGIAYVPIVGALHRRSIIDPKTGTFKGTDFAYKIKEEKSELLAKQMLGVAATVYVNHLVEQGVLTGSNPPGDKPKYSVKVGDTWYGYGRIEPLATVIGLAVDMHDLVNKYKKDPTAKQDYAKDIKKYGSLYLQAVADNITQKSFMEGFAKMAAAAVKPQANAASFLETYSTALIPAGIAAVARSLDPYEREVTTFLDKVRGRIPGEREKLPLKYGVTDGPVERSLGEVLLGIKNKTPNAIQTALEASGYEFSPIDKKIGGVTLSTEQLSEHKRLAANYFTALVQPLMKDARYTSADESMKEYFMKHIMTKAREAATRQMTITLVSSDKKFAKEYIEQKQIKKGQADQLLREQGRLQ